MDDSDLISGFLDGRRENVALLRSWIRAAVQSFRSHVAGEVEDLEQEILLELTQALRQESYRRQSQLRTYVRSYAHHKCIDRLRAARRREWVPIEQLEHLPSQGPSAVDTLVKVETTEIALRVVAEMPESCRELWRMLEEGLSYREMSRRLEVKEGALRARVLRCRRRALELRQQQFGLGDSAEPVSGSG